jgi:hypothetical protein
MVWSIWNRCQCSCTRIPEVYIVAVVCCCYMLLSVVAWFSFWASSYFQLLHSVSWHVLTLHFQARQMLRESNRAALIERTVTHAIRSPKHTAQGGFGVRTLGHSMKISISVSSKSRFLVVRPSIFPTYLNFYLKELVSRFPICLSYFLQTCFISLSLVPTVAHCCTHSLNAKGWKRNFQALPASQLKRFARRPSPFCLSPLRVDFSH